MARPTTGIALVDTLTGSEVAHLRVRLSHQTLSGEVSVEDAAAQLGVSVQRFHDIRAEVYRGALAAAEPKPLGRPASEPTLEERIAEACAKRDQQINDLRVRLEISQLREELVATGMDKRLGKTRKKKRR